MAAVTHTFVSAKSDGGDATLVRPSNWNDGHTIDWAEAEDLGVIAPAAVAGAGTTEVPRSDHVHQDSAAGRIYASLSFR